MGNDETGGDRPMLKAFTFEENGRTYECAPEARGEPSGGLWWWFTVSDDSQRYARFQAAAGDTRKSVRARIVAYYEHRVWVRAQPAAPHKRFGRPAGPAATPSVTPKGETDSRPPEG